MWSSTATDTAEGNSEAVSANGSSVSCHDTTSTSKWASGLAMAAGTSSAGTTMRAGPDAGSTRQVRRSSGIAS